MERPARGYTLLELMMVVGVIGILAMIALPSYQSYVYRAKAAEVVLVLDKIRTVLTGLQYERGAPLGSGLKVTTGAWMVNSFLLSQGVGSTAPVPEIGQGELSHPDLGLEIAVTSGWYNANSPGQYKISISWIPPLPGREEQSIRARQIALAVHDVMKPHTYLATVGSTETSLYFTASSATAGQGGNVTPTTPTAVTPPQPTVTSPQPVVTPPQQVVTSPQPVVTPPQQVVTPPQPVVSTPQPSVKPQPGVVTTQTPAGTAQQPVTKPPQQPTQTTTQPTSVRPPVTQGAGGSSQYDPGWYMNPLTPSTTSSRPGGSSSSSSSDPFWYMDPQAKPPAGTQQYDPLWYMDPQAKPPANTQTYDPLWYMDPQAKPPAGTQQYDPLWYMDPINRNWMVSP